MQHDHHHRNAPPHPRVRRFSSTADPTVQAGSEGGESMSEKCKTCDGTGSVPAEVETAEGPMPCPYIGAPCPDCSPMPEKVKVVRESVYRELVEALKALLACPAISDNNLSDPEWGCQESAEAEAKARAALSALTAGGDDG